MYIDWNKILAIIGLTIVGIWFVSTYSVFTVKVMPNDLVIAQIQSQAEQKYIQSITDLQNQLITAKQQQTQCKTDYSWIWLAIDFAILIIFISVHFYNENQDRKKELTELKEKLEKKKR